MFKYKLLKYITDTTPLILYINGLKQGIEQKCDHNGKVVYQCYWVDSKKHGYEILYSNTGKISLMLRHHYGNCTHVYQVSPVCTDKMV